MQLSNLEKLSQLKDNYVNDISKLQMITIQLINAIKRNDVSDIKTKMMTLRRSLFNNTFNSFENFIESYSIVYESEYYRFRDLFNFQYKTFLKTLIKYMEIINKPEILTKIQLKKYKIDSSIFESKYSFMKHHLPRYYIISRIKNYYYFKKFSNLFRRNNMQFTEHSLELSIMELFENEGYTHQTGQDIHREKTDVLLPQLLSNKLYIII